MTPMVVTPMPLDAVDLGMDVGRVFAVDRSTWVYYCPQMRPGARWLCSCNASPTCEHVAQVREYAGACEQCGLLDSEDKAGRCGSDECCADRMSGGE